ARQRGDGDKRLSREADRGDRLEAGDRAVRNAGRHSQLVARASGRRGGAMSEQRRALITGITGQDGSYLADLLLEKGYDVHGMVRRASTEPFQRLQHIRDKITLHTGDLLDQRSLGDVMRECEP